MLKVQSDYDYPLVIYCSYWKYVVHFQLIYPLKLKMVIFHSYVSLPQGTPFLFTFSKLFDQPHSSIHHTATFCTSNRAFKNSAASCAKQSLETCCAGRAGRCTRPGGPGRSRQVQAGPGRSRQVEGPDQIHLMWSPKINGSNAKPGCLRVCISY